MLRACLEAVAAGRAATPGGLAAELGVSEGVAAAMLADLAARGLLVQAESPSVTAPDPDCPRPCEDCPTPSLCGASATRAWLLTAAGRRAIGDPA
jgi:hypothetical protein